MESDQVLTSEGPGTQPGGIARHTITTEQSSKGPVRGRIAGSVGSGKGVKRKMNLQTYENKYRAILEVEKGAKKKDVAISYGVPANTLSTWIKNKDDIKRKFLDADIGSQRKRDRKAKFPELENALMQWFSNARSQNIPISGEIMKEKAKQFAEQLQISDFECSTGWLDKFKERHELTFKKVCGEANSVDTGTGAMSDWKTKLQTILSEYQAEDIFNADETGLFYRMMPEKTLEYKNVKCHGGKMSKERVTVMVCANMTGNEKLPLFVIGKSKNPRCFKNVKTMPIQYEANKKAWVTSEIFATWVRKLDRKFASQDRKIVLIVDNCPAHPVMSNLKSIKLVFLPPNTTSHTQPMDQGVIRNLKTQYRKLVIQKQLRAIETSSEVHISILDALFMLRTAWHLVSSTTIANCFRHAGFLQPESQPETAAEDPEDDIPLAALRRLTSGVRFDDYTSIDDDIPTCADLSDTDIINSIISQRGSTSMTENNDEQDNDDDQDPTPPRTISEALNGLDTVRDFLHQQGIGSETDRAIAQINDVSAMLSRFYLRGVGLKQSTMEEFFVCRNVSD